MNLMKLEPWMREMIPTEFDHLNPPNWIFYLDETDRLEFLRAMKRGQDMADKMTRDAQ